MHISTTENVGAQFTVIVHTGMQLETIVLTLPIVTRVSIVSGDSVVLSSHKPAYFQHGAIHEAKTIRLPVDY